MGVDLMHYNPHKTFSGPHGGGGPGAGPIAVREHLAPYLPAPLVARGDDGSYRLDFDRPKSIGRVRSFFGNVGVLVRAYCYIRSQGPEGLKAVAQHAVLNANYLMSRVRHKYPVPFGERCMHEFVASARTMARDRGVRALDIAKRLLDHNVHAPTIYFPLIVPEALMIEPTETESRETLDKFAEVLLAIAEEDPQTLHDAPLSTPISRPDEVTAARTPVLKWGPGAAGRKMGEEPPRTEGSSLTTPSY
jgi:glycine dehydrogenase subunit 2